MTSMKMAVFWDVAPCGLVDIDRRFRGAYCLHHHHHLDNAGQLPPLKRRSVFTRQHDTISQKTASLILVAMRTRNLTQSTHFHILWMQDKLIL
jgi:hypothetical protein